MRTFSPEMETILAEGGEIAIANYFQIETLNGNLAWSDQTEAENIVFDDQSITFEPDQNRLISAAVSEQGEIGGSGVSLTFLDFDGSIDLLFGENYIGSKLRYWIGLNDVGLILVSTGFCSNFTRQLRNSTPLAVADFAGRFSLVRGVKPMIVSQNWLLGQDSTDNSFLFLNAARKLAWGIATKNEPTNRRSNPRQYGREF